MSDDRNGQIGMLIESNREIKDAVAEVAKGVASLMQFQATQEERHKRFEKLEAKVEKLWDMVHKNALIVNGGLMIAGIILGAVTTWMLGA